PFPFPPFPFSLFPFSPETAVMLENITNLMQTVYQHFLDLYKQDEPSSEVFLAFEPIGWDIDPDSYKLNPSDLDFFPAKATEKLTELTDDIPAIDADVFRRTDKSVEETYGSFILYGGTPGTNDQGEVDLFNHLKATSKQKFEDTKIGKLGQMGIQYRPAYADPQDWYDPAQTNNWTTYTYKMSAEQTTSQGKPSETKVPTKPSKGVFQPAIHRWQWQVLPQDLAPVLIQPQIIKQVSLDPSLVDKAIKAGANKPIAAQVIDPKLKFSKNLNTIRNSNAQFSNAQFSKRSVAKPVALNMTLSEKMVSKAVLSEVATAQVNVQSPTVNAEVRPVKQMIAPVVLDSIRQQIIKPQTPVAPVASAAVQASTKAILLDSTYTQAVESNQLQLSFQYCLVRVQRPWLSHSLLQTKGWYVPGYEAGEFSNGTLDNKGLFPALPISFIVVKDLTISGWSQSEFKHVEKAMALGPFSLIDRKLSEQSLTWRGMQVIGWISQVMPFMPPLSDPNPD
ncbi:MAG: hypothetical protein WA885_25000, partial [Phormidesmis sp.]